MTIPGIRGTPRANLVTPAAAKASGWRRMPHWESQMVRLAGQPGVQPSAQLLKLIGAPQAWCDRKGLEALIGYEPLTYIDPTQDLPSQLAVADFRWHLSLKVRVVPFTDAGTRIPKWDELARACHELRPGVPFALGVPPRSMWMNVHEHVLHAWELADDALIDHWRRQGRGDQPT
jgi:hypothetical protein